ncbi:MAG: ATP-binding protein [Bacilli bacterium]|nr:ATP-binding protein [Bacilli bacterium]
MSTIRWSPVSAHLLNQAPGTVVCGSPGSGKTFALLNFAANCLGMGQKVIAIDPKNDFKKLYNVNPRIKIIDISNIQPGALNPFTFLKNIDEEGNIVPVSTSVIMDIIESLCGKLEDSIINAITPIVKDFVTRNKNSDEYVDMQDMADYLYANEKPQAQIVGTKLNLYQDSDFGKLLFTREQNIEPLELSATDSMIISLHGMQLPDYNKKVEDYNTNERLTSTIIYLITSKLLQILSGDNSIPTTLICDEAHLLFANPSMTQIIDRFLVLGRSLNVATIMASQGITHFPPDTSNYITSKFLFKSSIDEAQAFLERFDTSKLNPSAAIDVNGVLGSVTKFPTGVCFFMDKDGRNGIIRIKSIYDVSLLTSNPIIKSKDKQNNQKEEDE